MRHYGDITKINGYEVPIVDVITGGSPCQDLSVAGKRAGLAGQRSGLFMEQMRIVKEMRERDVRDFGRTGFLARPRYMVWENVPGAFSSNGGKDFQAVLTEIARVTEPDAPDVPLPEKGKWSKAGCLYGAMGEWSIAWRVHDAQFWGVPQRRKRISLVADFGGLSAPEILFEREGLSGDSEPCGEAWQEAAGAAGDGVEGAIFYDAYQHHGWRRSETSGTLTVGQNNTVRGDTPLVAAYGISSYDSNAMKSSNPHSGIYEADTARTLDLNGGSPACNQGGIAVVQSGSVMGVSEDVTGALRAEEHGHQPVVAFTQNQRNEVRDLGDVAGALAAEPGVHQQTYVYENHSQDSRYKPLGEVSETVSAKYGTGGNNQPLVVSGTYQAVTDALTPGAHPGGYNGQDAYNDMLIAQTISCGNPWDPQSERVFHGDGAWHSLAGNSGGGQSRDAIHTNAIVRRLTPLECERLQGYPDGWTNIGEWVDSNGKKHKDADSPRYKALGNSIALPFWQWMFGRIVEQYPAERRDKLTLGSLFDGIGGFPLTAQRNGIKPVWASEIEEFPIAVTKVRFPDESV